LINRVILLLSLGDSIVMKRIDHVHLAYSPLIILL
jgi:hypothetical protein